MIEIEDSDLINFFGVPPSPVSPDGTEFFRTTTFEVDRGGLHLVFSYSAHRRGSVSVFLWHKPTDQQILSVSFTGLCDLRVEVSPGGRRQLYCRTSGYCQTHTSRMTESVINEMMIGLDPAISVSIKDQVEE